MQGKDFGEVVAVIVRNDRRYEAGAYELIRQSLDYTLAKCLKKSKKRVNMHVSGRELLNGLKDFVLEQYGPMAMALLEQYGIRSGRDVGNIVFNLVEYRVFGKTEEDSIDDFNDCYDFREAFVEPYLPPSRRTQTDADK